MTIAFEYFRPSTKYEQTSPLNGPTALTTRLAKSVIIVSEALFVARFTVVQVARPATPTR